MSRIDLIGKTFGNWTVISINKEVKGHYHWNCICLCGTIKSCDGYHLRAGDSLSCGCIEKNKTIIHGHAKKNNQSRTYRSWTGIIERCTNKNSEHYDNYGGRGITVCEEWHDFNNFFYDMGERPQEKSIDRKDNNKGYNKDNCKWSTRKEQMNNTRSNIVLSFNGQSKTLKEWSDYTGISYDKLKQRIKKLKWTTEKALTKK